MTLRREWEANAQDFAAWVRTPGHDSYDRFHRDQFFSMLPAPGRLTLDLGCGEGRVSRDLRARGHHVVALDASPTMVSLARAADPTIPVVHGDASALPFADASADLVVHFMSLHDIDDLERAVAEAARVLDPGGRLCLAIVHPFSSAGRFTSLEEDSPFVVEGSYLTPHRTQDTVARAGLSVTFHSAHRAIAAYFAAFEQAGFLVESLREPAIPEEAWGTASARRWQRLPIFLHIRAVKPSG